MLKSLRGHVKILPSELKIKQDRDLEYLNWLDLDELLFSFREEAGLLGPLSNGALTRHGGWDGPVSQIRGTFTGHWLTAMANLYEQTKDLILKGKIDYIVDGIRACQLQNGDGWAFSIPEKYLFGLRDGKHFWAPFYVCHKELRGLFDSARLAGNDDAMQIISRAADWFIEFTRDLTPKQMADMMDLEETGGILELWADLYAYTGDDRYKILAQKFTRRSLLRDLLEKKDIFTNMHANITIAEVQGIARCYEVFGDSKYRDAVQEYWRQTVQLRGLFVTGGQTLGEVWTPKGRQLSRLGEMNQEHCVVFNMIRLADYLFRWTEDSRYHDFIEKNIYNGIFAQTFWQNRRMEQLLESTNQDEGIAAYFLPLYGGAQKKWSDRLDQFWCCHCTAVEANSKTSHWLAYQENQSVYIEEFFPADLTYESGGENVMITLTDLSETGEINHVFPEAMAHDRRPEYDLHQLTISTVASTNIDLYIRIPEWCDDEVEVVSDQLTQEQQNGHIHLTGRVEATAIVRVKFGRHLHVVPLIDAPEYQAILDGPVVLAGLMNAEKCIEVKKDQTILDCIVPWAERTWNYWNKTYQFINQPEDFHLMPLKDIGRERYTVYFPVHVRPNISDPS